jgi:hypothetical protein
MKQLFAALACAGFVSVSLAQGPGTGPGGGQGPGAGMKGPGMMMGRGNTPGWSLMTAQERKEHHDKMMGTKSKGECMALHDDHRKMMEQRAKEKGKTMPVPKQNVCDMMEKRGAFK